MMNARIPYDEIAKHLRKDASREEIAQLQQWIEESDENRELYKKILKVWKLQQVLGFHPKKELAWDKLEKQLDRRVNPDTRRVFLRRFLQIAALFVVLLGTGILFQKSDLLFGERMLAIQTTNKKYRIVLADGTEVFLNRNSELKYPERFKGDNRRVSLKGEAFFKVAKNPEKPFIIQTKHTKTKVLGTSFNLRAYSSESSETLSVTTGKVLFSAISDGAEVVLTPNEVGAFSVETRQLKKHQLKDPNYMAWLDKVFVFNDQALESIVASLSHAYGVEIEIQNSRLAKEHLTSSFNALSLDDVLGILSQTLDFEYTSVDTNKIIIK